MEPQESRMDATAALQQLDWVRALARSLVRDASLAEDITQEVSLAALGRPGASRGWLARGGRNAVRQENRRAAIRREHEGRAPVRDAAASTDEVVERVHVQRMVVDAVLALEEPYQGSILLRYFEDLTPREIAKRQGVPVATVKTRLRRGLGKLRDALDDRHGGERGAWMAAVGGLAESVGSGLGTGTLLIGGVAMGTMMKVSAVVLVVAGGVVLAMRSPQDESQRVTTAEPQATGIELVKPEGGELVSAVEGTPAATGRRSPRSEEAAAEALAVKETKVLRVRLEGVTPEEARGATVTVTGAKVADAGAKESSERPVTIRDTWRCQGLTSAFDLGSFFKRLEELPGDVLDDELVVVVDHPLHFSESSQVALSSGVEDRGGQTVYEFSVRLAEVVYWPEFTLAVRDANTRAHLDGVELRCAPTAFMGLVQQPGADGPFTVIGAGLSSPIGMRGGRKASEAEEQAAGLALAPANGEALQPIELFQPEETGRGVMVYARAPGYAWGHLIVDVSKGARRELFLQPAAALSIRLANVQRERYAELGKSATLFVRKLGPDGDETTVWRRDLDEPLETEVLHIESLEPGEYAALVELRGSWRRTPLELGRETVSIPAGKAGELLLVVPDPPEVPVLATLAGVVSFPKFEGEENARLEFYRSDYRYGDPDEVLELSELEPIAAARPTWSFRLEELPVDRYQVRLLPFQKSWMVELPDGGREDVELVIRELAEVFVETVDARTGQALPLEAIAYRTLEVLPHQVTHGGSSPWLSVAFEDEPGRFRFWTAPGEMAVKAWGDTSAGYGQHPQEVELVHGLQSLRLELSLACILRFEFRVDGAPLPHEDAVFVGLSQCIRAVGHDGRVGGLYPYSFIEASAPGLYEISFEGVGADRFQPIAPRRVDVRAGETTDVIVELRRR